MPIKRITNRKFLSKANTGIASVIGQATIIIKDFLLQLFPDGYIKDYYISTQLPNIPYSKQIIHKKKKPYLVITPKFTLDADPLFGSLYEYHDSYDFLRREMYLHHPIFADQKKDYYIYAVTDRINISYDITFVCNTTMEQINLAYTLKKVVPHKRPFHINAQSLEVEIPKHYIKYLALLNKYLNEDDNKFNEEKFQLYLDNNSQYAITKKIKASSGRYEYFFNFNTNFYINIDDIPSMDESNKENMSEIDARINDSLTLSFWTPSQFYFEHRDPTLLYNRDILLNDEYYPLASEHIKTFIPLTAFLEANIPLLPTNQLFDGRKLLYDFGYESEKIDEDGIEKINIKEICTKNIINIFKYLKKYNLNFDEYFKIIIFDLKDRLPDESIKVDWENFIINCSAIEENSLYHVCIYGDNLRIIRAMKSIEKINNNLSTINDADKLNNLFVDINTLV